MNNATKQHWDTFYQTKAENEVSWYQSYPSSSLKMIESCNLPLDALIIDIGGGDSRFAEAMLEKGYTDIHVVALEEVFKESFQPVQCFMKIIILPLIWFRILCSAALEINHTKCITSILIHG